MARARLAACYSDDYAVPTRFRNLEKLARVAEMVAGEDLASLVDPGVLDLGWLYGLHDPAYVDAFLGGERPLATSQNLPWSAALRRAVLAMQAGQLRAAELARRDGIAGHIANGFHHAQYGRGRGFCTFNGLALVAYAMPNERIFVLDCDAHGGDGTAAFAACLPNLFNYSICAEPFGCAENARSVIDTECHRGTSVDTYDEAIDRAMDYVRAWRPHLLIYQAGADPHRDDPFGRGLADRDSLGARDYKVFACCRAMDLPVLFTLSGGYQSPETTSDLHANTFRAARAAHGLNAAAAIA